ncbi:MAG: ABC transporter permease [Desulfobulbaceae bacterium]|nr:MAG: ABC transporter permease [Desulfobulbaceae bacterium]
MKKYFEKQRNLLDYALASLWRRKGKNISVFLVFSLVIFLLASFLFLSRSLQVAAQTTLRQTPEITVQRMVAGRQESMPLTYAERIRGIFGVRRVSPRVWGYHYNEVTGANITVMALAGDPELGREPLAEGAFWQQGEQGRAVIGQGVVKDLDLGGRRTFSFFRDDLTLKSFAVAGIFAPETNILTYDLVLLDIADGRDLFGLADDLATDLLVEVVNPLEIATVARKISERLPDTRVVTRPQIQGTYQAVFSWRSGVAAICLLSALSAFIILAWDKASGMSPEERREISILKILGWQTPDVLQVRFWEGFALSLLAFAAGAILAYVHVGYFQAALFRPVMMGWSVLRPGFDLVPIVQGGDLLLIFCLSVLPYLAATVVPAWRCAAVATDAAMGG